MKALFALALLTVLHCARAANPYIVLKDGDQRRGTLIQDDPFQVFLTPLPHDVDFDEHIVYIGWRVAATHPDVCLYASGEGDPDENHFHAMNCTSGQTAHNEHGYLAEVVVEASMERSQTSHWAARLSSPHHSAVEYLIRADIIVVARGITPPPRPSGCPRPPSNSLVVSGPYESNRFCFYQTVQGGTCDAACGSIGGSNLIDAAITTFPAGCPSHCTNEPINQAQQQGHYTLNSTSHPTAFRTCGYGYTNSYYVCHCNNDSHGRGGGSLVGDYNNRPDRTLMCPCFFSR